MGIQNATHPQQNAAPFHPSYNWLNSAHAVAFISLALPRPLASSCSTDLHIGCSPRPKKTERNLFANPA
eukprot:11228048-Lingulodinium_polyedra.AAC.1